MSLHRFTDLELYAELERFCGGKGSRRPGPCPGTRRKSGPPPLPASAHRRQPPPLPNQRKPGPPPLPRKAVPPPLPSQRDHTFRPAPAKPANITARQALTNDHKALQGKIAAIIQSNKGLSQAHQQHYASEMGAVIKAMPKAAAALVTKNLAHAQFYGSSKDIPQGMVNTTKELIQAVKQKHPELSGEIDQAFNLEGVMKGLRPNMAAGFIPMAMSIHVNGGAPGLPARGVYAHELGHLIDHALGNVSKGQLWAKIHGREINRGNKLSAYGRKAPTEGFAEFTRMVYASNIPHADIERAFPQATAYFKKLNLWPEAGRQRKLKGEKILPEIFDKRVQLGLDGSHMDMSVARRKPSIHG